MLTFPPLSLPFSRSLILSLSLSTSHTHTHTHTLSLSLFLGNLRRSLMKGLEGHRNFFLQSVPIKISANLLLNGISPIDWWISGPAHLVEKHLDDWHLADTHRSVLAKWQSDSCADKTLCWVKCLLAKCLSIKWFSTKRQGVGSSRCCLLKLFTALI